MDDRMRRILDVTGALAGLVVLAPVFAVVSALVRLDSQGPVFHRTNRIGLDGPPFTLFKFRSMVAGAALRGPAITADQDTRVTRVGRMLRRTKLDELPQLVNVLLGDMSLVGPRPEDPQYVSLYTPEQRAVLRARPGITSPASLRYRSEEQLLTGEDWEELYVRRVLPAKLAIDLDYLRRRTVLSDIGVIVATVFNPGSRGGRR